MKKEFVFGFYDFEKSMADKPMLRQPFGKKWEVYTWKEVGIMARKMANEIKAMGLPPQSHIGILSKNCREWVIADLAIILSGHVSVPYYATLTADQLSNVIELSELSLLFVGKLDDWESMKDGVPSDLPVIKFPHYEGNAHIDRGTAWNDILKSNEPLTENRTIYTDDIWTIIYTSGTTGIPKGVVLKFKQLDATSLLIENGNPLKVSLEGDNHYFSFLPLNHIAERVVVETSTLNYGGDISFAESIESFSANIRDTQPTFFFAVPRIWRKFQLALLSKMPQKKMDRLLSIPIVGNQIRKKIKKELGFSRARVFVSAAAPMATDIKRWFGKLGIKISEAYGMSESAGIGTFLSYDDDRHDSIGRPQLNVELKVDEQSGEILMKSPYNMDYYYKNPEKTEQTIIDGWLHTGDQGKIDEEGFVYLTGRVKDSFKTSKGKYIIPAPMEWEFESNPNIDQICVAGLGCAQPLALVVLSEIGQKNAKNDVQKSLKDSLQTVNSKLKGYQKISSVVVVDDPWTIDNSCLTPTLKIKRNSINKKYEEQLQKWDDQEKEVFWEKESA